MITTKLKLDLSRLSALKSNISRNITKKALRAGTKIVLQAVRQAVPVVSGALKKSLASKVDAKKGELVAFGIVGPRSKFVKVVRGVAKKPSRYSHFLESGRHPRPFLRPAWAATHQRAIEAMQTVLESEIERLMGS